MICDSHVHTREFSKDSAMPRHDLLKYADKNPGVIFTTAEHFDYDYTFHEPYDELKVDIEDYYNRFIREKNNYESSRQTEFPLLFGIEYGYLDHLAAFYDNLSSLRRFDSIISSVHCINGRDPYWDRSIYDDGKKQVFGAYLESISEMLEDCSGFDIVGHFDYISRYSPYEDKLIRYRDFPDHFDKIFELCIKKGKTLELNTGTYIKYKGVLDDYFFDPDIILRYKEMGGELISYGSDAHVGSFLFGMFEQTKSLLTICGYRYMTYYRDRKPYFFEI